MYKITIEKEGQETFVLEKDMFFLSVANRKDNGILETTVGYKGGNYVEYCRLLTTAASDIHKTFESLVEKEVTKDVQ